MSTTISARPYRRYLTSILHSRFVNAALLAMINGLAIAFCTGQDYFWSWFPLGPAGVKAVLFSMSSIFVFILQLATLSVGKRTSASPYYFLKSTFLNTSPFQTVLWYVISACWFCEIYIWSAAAQKELGWVIKGDLSTPDRLNERPIYLKFFFVVLALVQSGIHLYGNHSALHIPVSMPATPVSPSDTRTRTVDNVWIDLQRRLPRAGKHAIVCSISATVAAPFLYRAFFRNTFWQFHLFIAKLLFNPSRADAEVPENYFIGTIMGSAAVIGTLLSLTWEISAYVFLQCLKQAPLKGGLPLSAISKDPNGTLLTGLTAKRDVVRTFAFWELSVIASSSPDRRKTIFTDIERKDGPIWTSMHSAAMSVVSGVEQRLSRNDQKPEPTPVTQDLVTLPRLTKDVRRDKISAVMPVPSKRTEKLEDFIGYGAKSVGQSKDPWRPPIDRTTNDLISLAKTEIEQNKGVFDPLLRYIPVSLLNSFMSSKKASAIASTVLGTPSGNAAVIVDAVDSVTKMLIASLNEDSYGRAIITVPDTVKQFTRTILAIEQCIQAEVQNLSASDEKRLREVLIVLEQLKAGLRELLGAFQIFLNDVGLGIKELNEAKRAAESRRILPQKSEKKIAQERQTQEMEQVRENSRQPTERNPSAVSQPQQAASDQLLKGRSEGSRGQQRQSNGNVFGARDLTLQPSCLKT